MPDYKALLDLPFAIMWPLAAGYLSYRLAFVGRDSHHKTFDATFMVFVFASIARGFAGLVEWYCRPTSAARHKEAPALDRVLTMLADWYGQPITLESPAILPAAMPALIGFIATLLVAALYRCFLATRMFNYARDLGVLDEDGQQDAWRSMLARQLPGPTQLSVTTKAGKIYLCDDLGKYNSDPLGPCLLGQDGSVAMYITAWRKPGEEWQDIDPRRDDAGIEMSFFKASEIERIDITRRL